MSTGTEPPDPSNDRRPALSFKRLRTALHSKASMPLYLVPTLVVVLALPYVLTLLNPLESSRRPGSDGGGLGIKDLIRDVREELAESERARTKEEAAMFRVEEFDLEISFIVRADIKQAGKANYQVLTVDTEARTARENVQKLTLRMKAEPPTKGVASASAGPVKDSVGAELIGPVPTRRSPR